MFGKPADKSDQDEPQHLQWSPKQKGQLCYDYVCTEYLVKWYRNRQISAAFYTDATKELAELKKTNYAKKILGDNKCQPDNITPIPDIEAVRDLPSTPPKQKHNRNAQSRASESTTKAFETAANRGIHKNTKDKNQNTHSPTTQSRTTHIRDQRLAIEISKLQHENQKLQDQLLPHEDYRKQIKEERDDLAHRLAESQADFQDLEQYHDLTRRRLQRAEEAVQDLTLRLSKMAGDNMRHGNPNLADLSDPYRPTELGKMFAEVYDNQWSDAYEVVCVHDEKAKIEILYSIMMDSYRFCYDALEKQIDVINSCLLCPLVQDMEPLPGRGKHSFSGEGQMQNAIKDSRKNLAEQTAEQLAKVFTTTELTKSQDPSMTGNVHEKLVKYAHKCTEISWFMVICDPPLALSEETSGAKFNSDIFRPYTRTQKDFQNPVIEMTVWPALYLHEGGPLLSKGVAQPTGEMEFNRRK